MKIINSENSYGLVSILLHWVMAVAFIALYSLGLYMVGLDYYDSWYHQAPAIHKSFGLLLFTLMVLRGYWNYRQPTPRDLGSNKLASHIARGAHYMFYGLVLFMFISGYLISTAKGKGIEFFDIFTVPPFFAESEKRGELAGVAHEWLAHGLILLAVLHMSAAIKHHFVDKDATLIRMLRSQYDNQGDLT